MPKLQFSTPSQPASKTTSRHQTNNTGTASQPAKQHRHTDTQGHHQTHPASDLDRHRQHKTQNRQATQTTQTDTTHNTDTQPLTHNTDTQATHTATHSQPRLLTASPSHSRQAQPTHPRQPQNRHTARLQPARQTHPATPTHSQPSDRPTATTKHSDTNTQTQRHKHTSTQGKAHSPPRLPTASHTAQNNSGTITRQTTRALSAPA
jgi:hypothetical protein